MDNPKKKILVVENDKDFLYIIKSNFEKEGFDVLVSENGQEGLAAAEKEKPDLIILDILMPVMDGIEMAKQLKEKGIKIPIIFLTELEGAESMSRAIEIVQADYIVKSDMPVDKVVSEVKKKLGVN